MRTVPGGERVRCWIGGACAVRGDAVRGRGVVGVHELCGGALLCDAERAGCVPDWDVQPRRRCGVQRLSGGERVPGCVDGAG